MPEPILAPTTVPIVTPLVDPPIITLNTLAPVQAVSPQDAYALPPQYPGIPEPGQDVISLHATVLRLKETVEMMTGTRGDEESDLVGGYLLLQKSTENSAARLEIINQVTSNANFAMATQITTLESEFRTYTGLDPDGTTLNATLVNQFTVFTDADTANASAITALSTTVGTNTASITTLTASVNGMSVMYGVTGVINGVTGRFQFHGVLKNDGTISYGMEFLVNTFIILDPSDGVAKQVFSYDAGQFIFTGNVKIDGNLVITGTINNPKIADTAISNNTSASQEIGGFGGVGATCGLTIRQSGRLLITVMMTDGTNSLAASAVFGGYPLRQAAVLINSGHHFNLNMVSNLVNNQYLGGSAYSFQRAVSPSAAQFIYGPLGAGGYTVQIRNDAEYTLTFSVTLTELAK